MCVTPLSIGLINRTEPTSRPLGPLFNSRQRTKATRWKSMANNTRSYIHSLNERMALVSPFFLFTSYAHGRPTGPTHAAVGPSILNYARTDSTIRSNFDRPFVYISYRVTVVTNFEYFVLNCTKLKRANTLPATDNQYRATVTRHHRHWRLNCALSITFST